MRIAYGNPETILAGIRHDRQVIADFQSEVIQTFSCAARRSFWGDQNISDETIILNSAAPTSGFHTAGEFLRINGDLCNFNITLVLVAMRDGRPKEAEAGAAHLNSISSGDSFAFSACSADTARAKRERSFLMALSFCCAFTAMDAHPPSCACGSGWGSPSDGA